MGAGAGAIHVPTALPGAIYGSPRWPDEQGRPLPTYPCRVAAREVA